MNAFILFIQLKLRTMLAWAQGLWLDDCQDQDGECDDEDCGGLCLGRVEFVKRDLSVLEGPYSKSKTC